MKAKKLNLTLLLIAISLGSFCQTTVKDKLVGKWISNDKNEMGDLIFSEDGYISFLDGDQLIGGKEFVIDGKRAEFRYEIKETEKPYALDFIATEIETKIERGRMLCLFELMSDDSMKIVLQYEKEKGRPTSFDGSVTLTKAR